jgi:hypothetical protein
MFPVDPEQLAGTVAAALRQLPVPPAPATLLPRVMAAAQRWARRPWYARAWFSWPLGWQLASMALLVAAAAGVPVLLPRAAEALSPAIARINVAVVLWRTLVRPMAPYAAAFGALMCAACAVFAAALHQVAIGRTVPS